MNERVYLSPKTSQQLTHLLTYLEENWSRTSVDRFIKKLDRASEVISYYPWSFPRSNTITGLHKCTLSKQQTAYYRLQGMDIELIALFDTRQDPDRLKDVL